MCWPIRLRSRGSELWPSWWGFWRSCASPGTSWAGRNPASKIVKAELDAVGKAERNGLAVLHGGLESRLPADADGGLIEAGEPRTLGHFDAVDRAQIRDADRDGRRSRLLGAKRFRRVALPTARHIDGLRLHAGTRRRRRCRASRRRGREVALDYLDVQRRRGIRGRDGDLGGGNLNRGGSIQVDLRQR